MHRSWDHSMLKKRYNVYDNNTDMPVAIDQLATECAAAMKVKLNTFYQLRVRHRHSLETGRPTKWWIEPVDPEEDLNDE